MGLRCVITYLLIAFLSFSCTEKKKPLKMVKVSELGVTSISDTALVNILKEQMGLNIDLEYSYSEDETIRRLNDKSIDLAIIPNNSNVSSGVRGIRTILPMLPRVLLVLHDPELQASDGLGTMLIWEESRGGGV